MITNVVFDWKRTLYDPDDHELIDGAKEILEMWHQREIPLFLVGKGGDDMYAEAKRLGVVSFFDDIVFKEGIKEDSLFTLYISRENPSTTLFIGDRILSELEVGKSLGATTLWVRQGKFANEEPEREEDKPDYEVSSLRAATELLRTNPDLFAKKIAKVVPSPGGAPRRRFPPPCYC